MARMVDADDLGGAWEIADFAGVKLATAYRWATRPDFPQPVTRIGVKTGVWLLSEVAAWIATHPSVAPVEHGTARCRYRGCREPGCVAAYRAYHREYRRTYRKRVADA